MNKSLLFILVFGLIVRILLAHTFTYYNDFYTFQLWSLDLVKHGFVNFYSVAISDYLPGYLYILMILGKVFYWFLNHGKLLDIELVYKSPAIVADLANTYLIYHIAKRFLSQKQALLTALIAVCNLAFIANSTMWGQVESVVSFFLIFSVYALITKKYRLSAMLIGVTQIIKPIGILILPIYIIWLYRHRVKPRQIAINILIFLITILVAFIPFYSHGNFMGFVLDRGLFTTNYFPFVSLNAFNFWGLVTVINSTHWANTTNSSIFIITYKNWGYLLFLITNIFIAVKFYKSVKYQTSTLILAISLVYFSFFIFFTGLHERHFYYALIFLNIIILYFKKLWQKLLLIFPFIIYILNLYFSFKKAQTGNLYLAPSLYFICPIILIFILGYLLFYLHKIPKE